MTIPVLNAEQTAELLPFAPLCETLRDVAIAYAQGTISSPERQVLPLAGGALLLSMPATASDLGVHKLINFVPANRALGLPAIRGLVAVYSAVTGEPLVILDGPTVTARRTAAVSMVGIQALTTSTPQHFSLIGLGTQAEGHLSALAAIFPGARVDIHGRSLERAKQFCERHSHLPLRMQPLAGAMEAASEVVITLTNSLTPVYSQAVTARRLLVGVGAFKVDMAEYAPSCVNASQLFVDDLVGAPHEAGDLVQAAVDWSSVASLAQALGGEFDPDRPRLFKSVGCAAWDLAAGRCAIAQQRLKSNPTP